MPACLTFREQVLAVLTAAGFHWYGDHLPAYKSGGTFFLKPGVGVTVTVCWWDSSEEEKRALLLRFAVALADAGLLAEDRGGSVYVADPGDGRGRGC